MPARRSRVRITEINPQLTCVLCGGYYIDATTIIECLHSFCKTCIVRYLESSKYCPICDVQVHKTRPLLNIRPDQTLQDLVYKLVPGLFTSEMYKRRQYYKSNPPADGISDSEVDQYERQIHSADDKISIMLEFSPNGKPVITLPSSTKRPIKRSSSRLRPYIDGLDNAKTPNRRYLDCPAELTIGHLKKFVRMKFGLSEKYDVDIFYVGAPLMDKYALMDIAYIYFWKGNGPLRLFYTVYESPSFSAKRRKLTELPMNRMTLPTSLPVSLPFPVSMASSPSSEAPIVISSASPSPVSAKLDVASRSISKASILPVPSTSSVSRPSVPVSLPARVVPKGNRGPPAPPKPKQVPTQHVSPTTWSATVPNVSQVTLLTAAQKPSSSSAETVPQNTSKKTRDPNKPRKKSKKEGKKRKEKNRSGKEGKRKDRSKHKNGSKSKNGSREKDITKQKDVTKQTDSPTLVRLPLEKDFTTTNKETMVVKPLTKVPPTAAVGSKKEVTSSKPVATTSPITATISSTSVQGTLPVATKKAPAPVAKPAVGIKKDTTVVRSTPPTIKRDGMPQSRPILTTAKPAPPVRTLGDFSRNVPPVANTSQPTTTPKDVSVSQTVTKVSAPQTVTKVATFATRSDLSKSRLIAGPKTFITGGTTVPLISPIRPIPSQPLTNQKDKSISQLKDSSKNEIKRPVTLPPKPVQSVPVTTQVVRKIPTPPVLQSFSKPQYPKTTLSTPPPQTQRKISDYIQSANGPTPNPKPIVSHAMPQTVKMPIPGGNGVSPTRKVQANPLARQSEIAIGLKPVNGPLSKTPVLRTPVATVRSPLMTNPVPTKSTAITKSPVTTKPPVMAKSPNTIRAPVTVKNQVTARPQATVSSPVGTKSPITAKSSTPTKAPVTTEVKTLSTNSTASDSKVKSKIDKPKSDTQVAAGAAVSTSATSPATAPTHSSTSATSKNSQPVKISPQATISNASKTSQSKGSVQAKMSSQHKTVTSQNKLASLPSSSDKSALTLVQKQKTEMQQLEAKQPPVSAAASSTAASTSASTATTTTAASGSNSEQEAPLDLHQPKSVSVS